MGKYLMECRYRTGIKVQTEKWDGLERESKIKGYTVDEPGIRGASLRKEISRVLAGRGESMDRKPGIKALDGSAKASGTGGKHWDSVGKMFRMGKNRILKTTT